MFRSASRSGTALANASAAVIPAVLHFADEARRQQGVLLERLGYGPVSRPSRAVHDDRAACLYAYQPPQRAASAFLIVPAPIKRPYIWDLAPGASAVERCIEAGVPVYMLHWHRPGAHDAWLGLAHYADEAILRGVQAIHEETGAANVVLAGHSLGGTLAAIFASLHAELVGGLLVLEAPIGFGTGTLDAAAARAPHASLIGGALGNVPGTFIDLASGAADPLAFGAEPAVDLLLSFSSPAAYRLHLQVRRWSLDESPMPRQLFEEVLECLYRDDRFVQRGLRIGGRLADPRAVRAPILMVMDPRSTIVPPASMEPYRSSTASREVEVLEYAGDQGVVLQHVGVLVGPHAHASLWPGIVAWLRRCATCA